MQVNALPQDQKERLLGTINRELLIKILIDGKLVGNCLQFKDYELWFDNVYQTDENATHIKIRQSSSQEALATFAMNNNS